MYLVVFDANVWIRFARDKNIKPLTNRLFAYKLVPVVDNYLLSEIFDALVDNHWMNQQQAMNVINFIKLVSVIHSGQAVFRLSPDPKDNYLFDLAIQNNCPFIITDDNTLLQFPFKPVSMHGTGWFLKNFPVP